MPTRRVILAFAALALSRAAAGQTPARATSDNGAVWLTYTGVHPLTPTSPWRLHLEGQIRQSPGVAEPQGRLFRTALLHRLGASASAGAGYAFFRSYPYGGFSTAPSADEHRAYEQLELRHATGALRWSHRYRLEQRWQEQVATGGWKYSNRIRYQLRSTFQRHANTVRQPYASVYDELFVAFGRNVTGNVFDQNRAFAGVGYRWGDAFRMETGYMNQYVLRPSGREAERNHTLMLAFASDAPLFGR